MCRAAIATNQPIFQSDPHIQHGSCGSSRKLQTYNPLCPLAYACGKNPKTKLWQSILLRRTSEEAVLEVAWRLVHPKTLGDQFVVHVHPDKTIKVVRYQQ